MVESLSVEVRGMDCDHCVGRVKSALESIKGVERVEVSLKNGRATLWARELEGVRDDKVRKAITKAGFLVGDLERGV
jgi:copper chaperone CopZ